MIIILEGVDNCGKSTQTRMLQPLLIDKPLHVMHYMAIKGFKTDEEVRTYSFNMYESMFNILGTNYKNNNFILDRSHIGEVVYSPMYRNYNGDYVFDIEEKYLKLPFWNDIYLITFIDKAENLIKRDDGLSFTTELEKKNTEITAFREATNKSNIRHKMVLNIDGKDENIVFEEIKSFLKKA